MNLLIVLLLLIFVGVFIFNKFKKVDYIPNGYEKKLISYFEEVALKTEYGNNPKKILKWEKPMKIYVVDANKRQLKTINKVINQINSLVLNDFRVELVDEQKKCNTILYMCSMDYIKENNSQFYSQFSLIDFVPDGYAFIDWNDYILYKAFIYINPINSVEIHESTILEEITQCIGLPNDSMKYPNSIFYENKSEEDINIFEFSPLDKDVIQLLYHPRIKAGMNTEQVENEILKIFKNREIKLYGNYTGIKSYNHS
jgi:hypothetical protein